MNWFSGFTWNCQLVCNECYCVQRSERNTWGLVKVEIIDSGRWSKRHWSHLWCNLSWHYNTTYISFAKKQLLRYFKSSVTLIYHMTSYCLSRPEEKNTTVLWKWIISVVIIMIFSMAGMLKELQMDFLWMDYTKVYGSMVQKWPTSSIRQKPSMALQHQCNQCPFSAPVPVSHHRHKRNHRHHQHQSRYSNY